MSAMTPVESIAREPLGGCNASQLKSGPRAVGPTHLARAGVKILAEERGLPPFAGFDNRVSNSSTVLPCQISSTLSGSNPQCGG